MQRFRRNVSLAFSMLALGVLLAPVAQARPKAKKLAEPASAAPDTETGSTSTAASDQPTPTAAQPVVVAPSPTEPAAASGNAATSAPPPSAAEDAAQAKAAADDAARQRVTALRSDVTALMDDLESARAKAAVLGKALFKTRIVVKVQNLAGPDPVLGRVVLKLDGAPVFRGDGSALHDDEAQQVFEGFVAPGPHVLGVEIEQRSRDDSAYGYTLQESYRITALREKVSELTVVLDDDSSDAEDFAAADGEYDVRTRLRQKTRDQKER